MYLVASCLLTSQMWEIRIGIPQNCCNRYPLPLSPITELLLGAALDAHQRRSHESERMRHAGMPRGIAGDLRRMIGDQHPVETIAMQDGEHADHVDLTIVNEGFAIPRHLPATLRK